MNLRSILFFLDRGNKRWYDRDIEESLAYAQSFAEPKDLWQRSYYQYKCKNYDLAFWKKYLFSLVSIIILPFTILFFLVYRLRVNYVKQVDCIADCLGVITMIPESLKRKYNINLDVFYNSGYGLSLEDLRYLFMRTLIYLKEPYFLLHILFKIARYSNLIRMYNPSVIICHNEYSFTSSALTDYCRYHGITHINIQHGEKLVNIRNAFFEYDKCYVWNEHYKNLYLLLRCGTKPEDIIIEVPEALKIDIEKNYDQAAFANYKYYLGEQSFENLQHIVLSLKPLKECGYSVKFRPHPRYTNFDDISKLVAAEDIEWPSDIDIAVSIASCDKVIGSFSIVLLQAFMSGKGVLVDDVTYGKRIELQKKAKHLLLSVDGPELLSSHMAKVVNQYNTEDRPH